ncbi:hypothetical protein GFS03_08140 [Sulfolobus sp. E5-1-F]|nr:hypothetical protein GFS03_08140 [Sulfolobus sp. E5-1-F]
MPLVIPKRRVYRKTKGNYTYYTIYIPQDFNDLLPIPAFVTIIDKNETLKLGVRKPFKAGGGKYAIILPKELSIVWERIMKENREVTLVLEPLTQ